MKNVLVFLMVAMSAALFGQEGTLVKYATDTSFTGTGLEYDQTLGVNGAPTEAEVTLYASQKATRIGNVVPFQHFDNQDGWDFGTGWQATGGKATATGASGDLLYTGGLTITAGYAYEVNYTMTWTSGYVLIRVGNAVYQAFQGNQVNTILLFPTDTTGGFRIDPNSTFSGTFDGITVHEIKDPATVLLAVKSPFYSEPIGQITTPASHGYFVGGGGRYNTQGLNTGIGREAMMNITTGTNNVGYGYQALREATVAQDNTGLGLNSLQRTTVGNYNTAVGSGSMSANVTGTANTASGYDALRWAVSAGNNAAFGYEALNRTVSGGNNTAIGFRAGKSINSGSINSAPANSVFVGYDTRASASGNSNETVIGYNARGSGSNTVTLGNAAVSVVYLAGKVGWFQGSGNPNGLVAAPPGSYYSNLLGGAGVSLWVKETGTGNTGWVAK